MSEHASPERIVAVWSPQARADVGVIKRETAIQILQTIDRNLTNRAGDVKKLKPPHTGFRLRSGDCRAFFDRKGENTIEITRVKHRGEAYR